MGLKDEKAARQAKSIKRKLAKVFHDYSENGLSIYVLREKLKELDGGFDISYNTLRATLNAEDTSPPNLFAVIGLARLWHLDTASLLAPPIFGR